MSTFVKGGSVSTPFGRNEYLRSTQDVKTESYTVAAASIPVRTIDGTSQKILQPGTVMAKITSGGDSGKVGPFQEGATDGRQTLTNIVGLNDTFLPWQLLERDVEISVVYQATAVQAWCLEYTIAGGATPVALTNATRDAMRGGVRLHINFA
jgi:hypothetical protein